MNISAIKTLLVGIVIASLLCAIVFIAAAVALSDCSAGGKLASGRNVMTYSDGLMLTSNFSVDTATIKTAGYTIVVGPTKLIVDGRTVAKIDQTVADVKVHVQNKRIEFEADGRPVPYSDN